MSDRWGFALYDACVAAVTYGALVLLARILKRRLRVPFGPSFQIFAIVSAVLMAEVFHRAQGGPISELTWVVGGNRLVISVWAVLAALQINKVLTRVVWEYVLAEQRHVIVPQLLRDLVAIVLVVIAVLMVMEWVYGQHPGTLIAASSVAAVVLGFALQNLLSDVIAGIALNLERPFSVGDWIQVGATDGEVIEINWRATRIRTRDDNYLIVPNGTITKQEIVNFHFPDRLHAWKVQVGVEYGAAPNEVKAVLATAAAQTRGVSTRRAPRVRLVQFGDSAITYEIKFWIEDAAARDEILSDVKSNVWYALRRARMSIPFPIRDVVLHRAGLADAEEQRRRAIAVRALRGLELFRALNDSQVAELIEQGLVLSFGRTETIIRHGQPGDSLFVMLSGQASVRLVREDGGESVAGTLGAGDFFGEFSLLTGAPRGATIVAETDVRVIEIGKAAIQPVLARNPGIAETLSRQLAERRMVNEGFFKTTRPPGETSDTRDRYAVGILRSIREFFRA
jgi:small-conductance mechanosensitive channel/CRP-like cAMP-binding protein